LRAKSEGGHVFYSLARFYRRGYLGRIDGTKRRPELRQQGIATMVEQKACDEDYRNPSARPPH